MHHAGTYHRGHQHNLSTNSLEAERADRISRLTGLGGVAALRGPPASASAAGFINQGYNANSPQQAAPTSNGFAQLNNSAVAAIPGGLTPAYFDAAGQPVAATKMSTVGSASATESVGGRTTATETETETETRDSRLRFDGDDTADQDDDDDKCSMDPNGRDETETEMDSASGYMGMEGAIVGDGDGDAVMDDELTTRSVGGFDMDRISDDGTASLVGFGEGAGSTVSGPIYHRRPFPGQQSSASAMANGVWGLERSSSGLSEAHSAFGGRRDVLRALERESGSTSGGETPISQSAVRERREALMVGGVALDGMSASMAPVDDDVFVDTTTRGAVPLAQPLQANISAIRETQQPHSHQQQQQQQHHYAHAQTQTRRLGSASSTSTAPSAAVSRETAERIIRERLDHGENRIGNTVLGSPKGAERLGRFYLEERK